MAMPLLLGIALAGCEAPMQTTAGKIAPAGKVTATVAAPRTDTAAVDAYAKSLLDALQPRSIAESREYCGFIYRRADGGLAATPATPGDEASCDLPYPSNNTIASYHTHGSYSARYDNEVPSTSDLLSDFEFGTDGYISTPGGRLWRVDHQARIAYQICAENCVYTDPRNDPSDAGFVAQSYTVAQLRQR
jgi:hypothetical protein